MKKKKFIPTRRKRLKDKQLADTITIKLLSMIDELHNAKGSVDLSKLENMLNDTIESETTDSVHEWYNERKSTPMNQVIILPQEEIEKHFAMCDFDDTCDVCDDPQGGSYADGYSNNECGCEIDYYICGKCASMAIREMRKNCNEIM